ncbi:hypothetical protein H8959_000645 [Pygathrix nigripes]
MGGPCSSLEEGNGEGSQPLSLTVTQQYQAPRWAPRTHTCPISACTPCSLHLNRLPPEGAVPGGRVSLRKRDSDPMKMLDRPPPPPQKCGTLLGSAARLGLWGGALLGCSAAGRTQLGRWGPAEGLRGGEAGRAAAAGQGTGAEPESEPTGGGRSGTPESRVLPTIRF